MAASAAAPGGAVIEVRTLTLGGAVKAVTVRRSWWRSGLRRTLRPSAGSQYRIPQ
jgi:hypothetical protein